MGRRVVMLPVVGVDRCCGGLNCLGVCMEQRLNLTWLKLRTLGWIMDRQTCSNCSYKLVLLSANENQCWGGGICAVFSYMRDCLKNIRKKYLRISPRCCFLIVVISRNELGGGIVVDTGWIRMLWLHSKTVYGRNVSSVCGELWRIWYCYVIGKGGTAGEGPGVGTV